MQKFLSLPLIGLAATAFACDQQATVTNLDVEPLFAVWGNKVIGGGELTNEDGRTVYSQISVTDFDEGSGKGVTGQLERYAITPEGSTWIKVHGVVDALLVGEDGYHNTVVNVCGTITQVQEDGERITLADEGKRFGFIIRDVTDGPDWDRFTFGDAPAVDCAEGNLQTEFPFHSWMVSGDYRVKSDS